MDFRETVIRTLRGESLTEDFQEKNKNTFYEYEELLESTDGDKYLAKHKIKDIHDLVTHLTNKVGSHYDKNRTGNQKQYKKIAGVDTDPTYGGVRINRAELHKATGITRKHITKLHKANDHSKEPYQTHHGKTHTEIHMVDFGDEN